jgi:hypothetical protein
MGTVVTIGLDLAALQRTSWEGRTRGDADSVDTRTLKNPHAPERLRARAFGRDQLPRKAYWPAVMQAAPTGRTHGRADQTSRASRTHLLTESRPHMAPSSGPSTSQADPKRSFNRSDLEVGAHLAREKAYYAVFDETPQDPATAVTSLSGAPAAAGRAEPMPKRWRYSFGPRPVTLTKTLRNAPGSA